jgi:hypothetical protein
MENVEKLRVMLQHWIEHNKGHVEEFEKWREVMRQDGQTLLAGQLAGAIATMSSVNELLAKALHDAGGPQADDHHHHHHHHNHSH